MPKALTVILFLITIGCSSNQTKTVQVFKDTTRSISFPIKPLIVENDEEEGWGADIRLSITEVSKNDTANIYKAISTYQGKNVGLLILVPEGKEGKEGFGNGIVLKSIGKESDNLLQTLENLYKQKIDTSSKFTDSLLVSYINLKTFAKSLTGTEGEPYSTANEYKLFFEGKKDDYAELYVNINVGEHWIELREKDEEYRPLLIKFLTAPAPPSYVPHY